MIRLVTFDVWGTLVRAPAMLPELMVSLLASEAREEYAYASRVLKETGHELDQVAAGSGVDISSVEKLSILLQRLKISHVTGAHLGHEIRRHLALAPLQLIEPDAVTRVVLECKRREIAIGFVSNSGFIDGALIRGELTRLGLIPEGGHRANAFSDECRLAKPNPEIFRHVAGSVHPSSVLHIGDNYDTDMIGASAFGGNGLLLRHGLDDPGHGGINSVGQVVEALDRLS